MDDVIEKAETDIKRLKKAFLLIVILGCSLALVFINRSYSYSKYQRVQFESAGATLFANLYYPTNEVDFQEKSPLLIYAHGIGYQRDLDLRIPLEFSKRGFYVAAIDYQGHGESEGSIDNLVPGTNMPALAQDCSRLLDSLEKMPFYSERINASQIGLIGHSLGGFAVLMTQALDPRFSVTVAWAPLVDPSSLGSEFTFGQQFKEYWPVNYLNNTNTQNLLIIAHVNDEALPYEKNALIAQQKTGCELINITEFLIGGGHALYSHRALEESINWFENLYFKSETLNGPIVFTWFWTYVFIFIALFALILTSLTLIFFSAHYFTFKSPKNKDKKYVPKKSKMIEKTRLLFQWAKIISYILLFVGVWLFFQNLLGTIGLFFGSFIIFAVYIVGKIYVEHKVSKSWGKKFNLKEEIKGHFDRTAFLFTFISTGYYLGLFYIFTFSYPFAFVFPTNLFTVITAFTVFPLYFSLELLYRKMIYPSLYFIRTEKQKAKIIAGLAVIIQAILILSTLSWSLIPVVLFTHLIFLMSVIYNTAIYQKTKNFSSIVLSSLLSICFFFSAVISQSLGMGSVLFYFV